MASGNAQGSGETCLNAISITPQASCNYTTYNMSTGQLEKWFSFTADTPSVGIFVVPPDAGTDAQITGITLYAGSCENLSIISQTTTLPLSLGSNALTIGNTYYIKVIRQVTIAGDFKLCSTKSSIFEWGFEFEKNNICCGETVTLKNIWYKHFGIQQIPVTTPTDNCFYIWNVANCTYFQIDITWNPITLLGTYSFVWNSPCPYSDYINLDYIFNCVVPPNYTLPCTINDPTHFAKFLTVNPKPTVTGTANPSTICKGSCATLTASGASTYTWSYGLGNGNTKTVCPVVTTTYYVTGTDVNGCTNSASTVVSMNSLQKPTITGVNNICDSMTSTYRVNYQGAGTGYTWDVTGWAQNGNPVSPICGTITYTLNNTTAKIPWSTNLNYCVYARIIVTVNNVTCTDKDTLYVFPCCHPDLGGVSYYLNNTSASAKGWNDGTVLYNTTYQYTVNGEFIVDRNLTLQGTGNWPFAFGPNAKMTIVPGKTLTINNYKLQAGCCYMWDGIYVGSNAVVNTSTTTTITDAKNAVVSNNGGIYNINNTIFDKNYKGIIVNPYNTASHQGSVKASTFSCSSVFTKPMLPPVSPVATHSRSAIEVYNVQSLKIGNETNVNNLNTFSGGGAGIDVGIFIKSSGVTIYNNAFTNFNVTASNPPDRGVAIYSVNNNQVSFLPYLTVGNNTTGGTYKNTITGCRRGIYSLDNIYVHINDNTIINTTTSSRDYGVKVYQATPSAPPPGYVSYINNNEIYYLTRGIDISYVKELEIDSNTIRVLDGAKYGIYASACENSVINKNKIYGNTKSVSIGANLGLCYGSVVTCNDIQNLDRGVQFTGTTGVGSHIEVNTIKNNYYGFYLNSGLVGPQGSSGAPSDNDWGNTQTSIGICPYLAPNNCWDLYAAGSTVPSANPFWYKNPPLSFYPIKTGPQPFGFLPISPTTGNSGYTCSGGGQGKGMIAKAPTADNIILMNSIADEKISFTVYDAESKWLAKEGVYKYLSANKDSLKDESMKKIKEKWDNENFGLLQQVENAIAKNNLESAQSINASIKISVKPEKALKDYFAILINCKLNNWKLNKQDLYDLTNLAKQCPLEYGSAVYKARALLSLFDGNEYTNKCEATTSKDRGGNGDIDDNNKTISEQTNQSEKEIKVYPNPANNELFVEYHLEKEQKGMLEIFDLVGNRIVEQNLINSSNLIKISLNDFNSGFYFYKIIIDGKEIKNDKLSIIK